MKKIFLSIILVIIVLAPSCLNYISSGVKGNGTLKTKEIAINDYNKINIYSIGDITYEQKEGKPYLRLETDENLIEYFKIQVEDSVLNIQTSQDINPQKGCKIYTNSKQFAELKMSGVGNVELAGNIKGENLSIENTGVSSIKAMSLDYQNISTSNSGVGNVTLGGKTVNLSTNLSGVGNIDVIELDAENTDISNSGVGKTKVKNKEN